MAHKRILVVEGDRIARDLLGSFLGAAGYEVAAMASGEAALLALRERRGRFDHAVIGAGLPGLVCGAVLADEFRACNPGGSALVLKGAASPAAVAAALQRTEGDGAPSLDLAPALDRAPADAASFARAA